MKLFFAFLPILLFPIFLSAQFSGPQAPPVLNTDCAFQPLRTQGDAHLQAALQRELKMDKKMERLIAQKKISIGLVDLMDPDNARFAQINGDKMMYAASLPKIAVLLAAMDAIECGDLKETDEIRRDLFLMINKSNNAASTRMIDRVSFDRIEAVLL